MSDLDVFREEFVPNIESHARLSFASWRTSAQADYARWVAYRDALLAGQSPSSPAMTTKYGKALVAAGRLVEQGAEPPPPPPPPPPSGDLLYSHTYTGTQAVPPDYGWDWGYLLEGAAQAQIIPDGLASGLPAMRATLPSTGSSLHSEGVKKWTLTVGEHRFFGLQFRLPMNWTNPNNDGWGAAIAQLYYQSCVNHTWGLFLHADHCRFVLLSGKQTLSGTSVIREYNNGDGAPQGPAPRAIPVGRLALGKRHTLIAEIVAAYDPVGLTRIWHRIEGEADFTKTVEVLNIPTLQYGMCYAGNTWPKGATFPVSHKVGFYAGSSSQTRVYDGGNFQIGDTFDAVAVQMR